MDSANSISIVTTVAKTDFQARTPALTVSYHFQYILPLFDMLTHHFAELDLPEYDSYESLRKCLYTAMTAGSEYFGFA